MRFSPFTVVSGLVLAGLMGCVFNGSQKEDVPAIEGVPLAIFQPPLARLDNLPRSTEDQAKVDLGRHLYYEKRLSSNNQIACNSCHLLDQYGVDGLAFSLGVPGTPVGRNSPTTYNAFFHIAQFWDGRAATVEEQAKGPILAGKEMGMPSPEAVVAKLKGIAAYPPLFKAAFPRDTDPVSYNNVGTAIGAFERNLVTPGRFDDFLAGDASALTAKEQRGLKTFVTTGCVTCHTGPLVGGNSYQKLGLVKPWPNQDDPGRSAVLKNDAYKMFFKVPSLRNIEKTGPYFHDASEKDLAKAIVKMAKHQLGRELDSTQVAEIEAFLKCLTGELPVDYLKKRELP
jgi:cytochrome c peroxidase